MSAKPRSPSDTAGWQKDVKASADSVTSAEKAAIDKMRRAIKEAYALGIRLAGMDGALLFATASAFAEGKRRRDKIGADAGGSYGCVALAVQFGDVPGCGTLDRECYEDSGGW